MPRWLPVLIAIVLPGSAWAQEKIQKDIVYGKVGEKELKLDLLLPKGEAKKYPLVLCVHGGGWRMGNKRDCHDWLKILASEGFVAASVGYRLAPDCVFPGQIEDCKTALKFLRQNAEKYQIDGEHVGALGFSAGGHLVALMGLTEPKDGFEGTQYKDVSTKLQCVVDYFGPTDLSLFGKDDIAQKTMLGPLIGAKYSEKPEAHDQASPMKYVRKEAPPFLMMHGTKDWMVPIEHSQKLAKKLKDLGNEATLVEVPGASHGWNGTTANDTTDQTITFLKKHLKK